ncbi:hypothetical protein [Roseburia hominis]|uniref:hypothetical protein n=1 Tax=Roseburia hominis TaxID=301301 RepID=UPI0022E5047F|nr:hypothetical protein [Roseburia hominis]
MEKNHPYIGIFASLVFVSFFSDDLYILVQFTKTATAAMCAGGALLLYGLWEKKKTKKILPVTMGILLALVGSMVRYSTIYIVLVFLVLIFIEYVWIYRRSDCIVKKIVFGIMISGITVGGAYALTVLDSTMWKTNVEYGQYKVYNHQRASVTDVNGYGSDTVMPELEKLGVSLNDYYMIETWNFLDQDYFTPELISDISKVKKDYSNQVTRSLQYVLRTFIDRQYEKYLVAVGVEILFLLLLFCQPEKVLWSGFKAAMLVILLMYFIYRGRVVYRVEYSVFFAAAVALATSLSVKEETEPAMKRIMIYFVTVLCLCKIPLYIPDTNYQHMDDEEYAQYISDCFYESWNFKLERYRCSVSKRQPQAKLMQMIESDTEHYYLIDFSSGIQLLYFNYKPWIRMDAGSYNRYSYLGGVTMGYPDNGEVWGRNGIDSRNPYISITNNNIYVVDNLYRDIKLWYVQEHYDEKVQVLPVYHVDGFSVWKYVKCMDDD